MTAVSPVANKARRDATTPRSVPILCHLQPGSPGATDQSGSGGGIMAHHAQTVTRQWAGRGPRGGYGPVGGGAAGGAAGRRGDGRGSSRAGAAAGTVVGRGAEGSVVVVVLVVVVVV